MLLLGLLMMCLLMSLVTNQRPVLVVISQSEAPVCCDDVVTSCGQLMTQTRPRVTAGSVTRVTIASDVT